MRSGRLDAAIAVSRAGGMHDARRPARISRRAVETGKDLDACPDHGSWGRVALRAEQHGTETAAVFAVRADEPPAAGQVVRSGPVHPAVLRSIVHNLRIEPREFTLVDFGSGKGRALLCAAGFPFKRIVGIEWSTDLCTIARRNIDIFRSRHPSAPEIQVNCLNVLDYEMPPGPVVVYIFNPFGPKLTRAQTTHSSSSCWNVSGTPVSGHSANAAPWTFTARGSSGKRSGSIHDTTRRWSLDVVSAAA